MGSRIEQDLYKGDAVSLFHFLQSGFSWLLTDDLDWGSFSCPKDPWRICPLHCFFLICNSTYQFTDLSYSVLFFQFLNKQSLWYFENQTFFTVTVAHQYSGRRKDWRCYRLTGRDWVGIGRERARRSGRIAEHCWLQKYTNTVEKYGGRTLFCWLRCSLLNWTRPLCSVGK